MATRTVKSTAKPAAVTSFDRITLVNSRETVGTFVYLEVDANGDVIEDVKEAIIGKLYIRKSRIAGAVPQTLAVDIRVVE